jgi:Amino acid permease
VNTAIVGSNGVLNRVSEDGILPPWFRQPHHRFGTTHRMINLVVGLQIATIILSRGNIFLLGEAYAFGVMWSFFMNSIAVLALRYKQPGKREFEVPFNYTVAGIEIPVGLVLISLTLLALCTINLLTKQIATISGIIFTAAFFATFTIAERITKRRGEAGAELDQFNVASQSELSTATVGVRPGNVLVPVSNYHALYHLAAVLDRVKTERRDIVVLHVQVLHRTGSGEVELAADQLFGSVEQLLFTKALAMAEQRGKPIRLAVVAANDLWDGILRAAANLQSASIVLGRSSKMITAEQARQFGLAWEALPDPRPPFNLEIFSPQGEHEFFLLGPHAPHLTRNEVNLVHELWLRLSDLVTPEEVHHHDVVHFALNEVKERLSGPGQQELAEKLREHLSHNKAKPPS